MRFGLALCLVLQGCADSCLAQAVPPSRGKYTPGFSATNSGVMPEPGLTYLNTFMDYSFDQVKGSNGQTLPAEPSVSVLVDINVFVWVSKQKVLGANYGLVAGLPITNSSLS